MPINEKAFEEAKLAYDGHFHDAMGITYDGLKSGIKAYIEAAKPPEQIEIQNDRVCVGGKWFYERKSFDQSKLAVWLYNFEAEVDSHGVQLISWEEREQRTRDAYHILAAECIEAATCTSSNERESIKSELEEAISNLHYQTVPYEAYASQLGAGAWHKLDDTKTLLMRALTKLEEHGRQDSNE